MTEGAELRTSVFLRGVPLMAYSEAGLIWQREAGLCVCGCFKGSKI